VRSKYASCLLIVLFEQYSCPAAITQFGKYNCVINLNVHIGSLSYTSFGLNRCMKGSEPRPLGLKGLRTRGLYVGSKAVNTTADGRRTACWPHPDNTSSSLNTCGPLLFQYETCLCWRGVTGSCRKISRFFTAKHISVQFIILPHDIRWSLYTSAITTATHLEL